MCYRYYVRASLNGVVRYRLLTLTSYAHPTGLPRQDGTLVQPCHFTLSWGMPRCSQAPCQDGVRCAVLAGELRVALLYTCYYVSHFRIWSLRDFVSTWVRFE